MRSALFLLVLLALPASGASIAEAQGRGWLPLWLDATDDLRVVERKEGDLWYLYRCFVDAQTGAQWVLRTRRARDRAIGEGRDAIDWTTPKRPLTATEVAVCFTTPAKPRPLGEPVYNFVAYTGARGTALKWSVMNELGVLRPSVATEECGTRLDIRTDSTDPKVFWYVMQTGGVTRCRQP